MAYQKKTKNIKRNVFHIRKNDLVEVITGEEKERRGRVLEIIPEKNMAIVEGINLVKKHQRARSQTKPSGIVTVPGPIHISDLTLICPKCGKKAKVRMEKIENKRVRICKKCGESLE
jgi:large subunit ribosomal protein L24